MKRLWLILFLLLYVSCFTRPNPTPKLNIPFHRVEIRENFLSGCLLKKAELFNIRFGADGADVWNNQAGQSLYPSQKLDWSYNTKLHWMEMCELYNGNYITYFYEYEDERFGNYNIIGDCFYCN